MLKCLKFKGKAEQQSVTKTNVTAATKTIQPDGKQKEGKRGGGGEECESWCGCRVTVGCISVGSGDLAFSES